MATPASSSSSPGFAAQGAAGADAEADAGGTGADQHESQQAAAGAAAAGDMAAGSAAGDVGMADEDADAADWGDAADDGGNGRGGGSCPAGTDEATYVTEWSNEQNAAAAAALEDEDAEVPAYTLLQALQKGYRD